MQINKINKFLYLVFGLSIFIELYFNIDSAGSGGFINDFNHTWPLVENPLQFSTDLEIKFPLHYYIASLIYLLFDSKELLRFFYCFIFLFVPYLFFLCLKNKFKKLDINNLFLFFLIIFILPSVRSAAVWPNTQITAINFFLISLFFFLKWEKKKEFQKIKKKILLTIFFMSLTVYTRQIYAMIFAYFMLVFFLNCLGPFFKTVFVFCLALPGIFL